MKFLIFACVIVFILGDHGTFQTEPIDKCSKDKQVALFKKYALELVIGAVPPLQENKDIMEDGCKCIPIVEEIIGDKVNPVMAIFATFSIAKDYDEDLVAIKQASDLSKGKITISDGMMENIRRILLVLHNTPENDSSDLMEEILLEYLSKDKRVSFDASSESSEHDERLERVVKCYRAALSMDYGNNKRFFEKFNRSLFVASHIIDDDDKGNDDYPEWTHLRQIIVEEMSPCRLSSINFDYAKSQLDELLKLLNYSDSE